MFKNQRFVFFIIVIHVFCFIVCAQMSLGASFGRKFAPLFSQWTRSGIFSVPSLGRPGLGLPGLSQRVQQPLLQKEALKTPLMLPRVAHVEALAQKVARLLCEGSQTGQLAIIIGTCPAPKMWQRRFGIQEIGESAPEAPTIALFVERFGGAQCGTMCRYLVQQQKFAITYDVFNKFMWQYRAALADLQMMGIDDPHQQLVMKEKIGEPASTAGNDRMSFDVTGIGYHDWVSGTIKPLPESYRRALFPLFLFNPKDWQVYDAEGPMLFVPTSDTTTFIDVDKFSHIEDPVHYQTPPLSGAWKQDIGKFLSKDPTRLSEFQGLMLYGHGGPAYSAQDEPIITGMTHTVFKKALESLGTAMKGKYFGFLSCYASGDTVIRDILKGVSLPFDLVSASDSVGETMSLCPLPNRIKSYMRGKATFVDGWNEDITVHLRLLTRLLREDREHNRDLIKEIMEKYRSAWKDFKRKQEMGIVPAGHTEQWKP